MPELRRLTSGEAAMFESFTFPAYRHLLALEPHVSALLDPAEPEKRTPISPFALGAFDGDAPVGLVLAAIPDVSVDAKDLDKNPQILSLYVAPAHRKRGIGTALLATAEEHLREHSQSRVHGIYMTGKPSIDVLERIFAALEWDAPEFRFASARFEVSRLLEAEWIQRLPTIRGYEAVPWREIGDDERQEARRRDESSAWVHPALRFWKYAPERAEPVTSLGIRYRNEFVGWVLNHAFQDSKMLRFTCTFIRWDLARLGMALPAVARSIGSMPEAGFTHGTFCTPEDLQGMRRAIAKYVAPWADFVGETRGVYKELT